MKAVLYGKRGLITCSFQKWSAEAPRHYGGMPNAYRIVDETPSDNPVAHMQACIKQNSNDEALEASQNLQQRFGTKPNPSAFIFVLKEYAKSADWEQVTKVHTELIQDGMDNDAFICSTLIDIYAKLGSMEDAFQLFSMVRGEDVVMWNAMIAGYTDHGHSRTGLCLFAQMQHEAVTPSKATVVAVLKSCTTLEAFEEGKKTHVLILWNGLSMNMHVASSLIDMYGRCRSMLDACRIFESMRERDTVLWNVIITVHTDQGLFQAAHALFEQMKQEGMLPNNQTVLSMLKACAKGVALKEGIYVHAQLIKSGYELDLHVMNALIDMYMKCVHSKDACEIFDNLHDKSVVSWNVMLLGYTQQGLNIEALSLFQRMHQDAVNPDSITLTTIIKSCTALTDLELGKQIHTLVVEDKVFQSNIPVCSALIEMYAICKSFEDALAIFHSTGQSQVVVWNALITAYTEQGLDKQAFAVFDRMQQGGTGLDIFTYVNILKTCTKALKLRLDIYDQIVKIGVDTDHLIITSLVDMFAKCGSLEDGHYLFESSSHKDVALWTTMISGYCQHSVWDEAALLLKRMEQEAVEPDRITLIIALKVCGGLLDLEWGKQIHDYVLGRGLQSEVSVANTIMDMYVRCKCINRACEVFKNMSAWNIVSWNVMIAGFVQEGQDKEALQLFKTMCHVGGKPDGLTYNNALKACSMLGALELGKQLHAQVNRSGLEMDAAIWHTLIDMYIKCGNMGDAYKVFKSMPVKDIVSWNVTIAGYAQYGLGNEVMTALEQMQATGMVPDKATLSGVLSACNHVGLKVEGYYWFLWFILYYGVLPTAEIYASLVDMLCRAGCLLEAKILLSEIPMQPNAILWMTVLGACSYHGDVAFGRFPFAAVIELGTNSVTACSLLSNTYAAVGGWNEAIDT